MKKKVNKHYRTLLIVTIFLFVASILSLSFAWFTDKKEASSSITFGNILLDVTGASAGENGELKFNVTRNELTTTTVKKVMPGDIVNIDLTIGLKSNSQPAYYLLKLTDKTNKVFKNSFYFSDGTVDSSNNLIVYQTDGETSWEQNDETKTTTKMVGKISNPDKHNITIKAEISEDYDDANSKTEIICDIYAIQQANLTESEAKNYLLAGLNSDVPLEYTEVEYIESTGTQWIDTGVLPTEDVGVSIDFMKASRNPPDTIFGSMISLGKGYYGITIGPSKEIQVYWGTNPAYLNIGTNIEYEKRYKLDFNLYANRLINIDNSLVYDINTKNTGTLEFSDKNTITLCRLNGYGSQFYYGKIYSCKIYNGSTLVRSFAPCVRNSDGVAGMFDKVEQKFYANAGTGEFNTGDIVLPSDYTKKEYIQASGEQYIKTDYTPTSNTKIDLDVMFTDRKTTEALFCARAGLSDKTYSLFAFGSQVGSTIYRTDWNNSQINTTISPAVDVKYNIQFSKGVFAINNTINKITDTSDFTAGGELMIFGSYTSGNYTTVSNYGKFKLYGFKIYENNTLVRNFVPCVRNSDGKAGLYDMVTKSFLVNGKTGADFTTN